MGLTVNVQDYPVREWVESDTGTGSMKFTLTVLRDNPDAATLRICAGNNCVDVDISDIPLGQTGAKTAEIACCDSAGTVQAQAGTINTCPGDTFSITAPADKARAYNLILAQPINPPDAPTKGVVLPGKSATFKYSDLAEDCYNQPYYDVSPGDVVVAMSVTFQVLDANGNVLDETSVTITDARPFVAQAFSGNVEVTVEEVL